MPIETYLNPQRDFSAGEIDVTAQRRDDTDIMRAGARKMLNTDVMLAGGFRRRPGTDLKFYGEHKIDRIEPYTGHIFDIEFREGQFRARDDAGTLQTLSAPWTAGQFGRLRWKLYDKLLFVVARGEMVPQVIEYDEEALTFSIRDFAFEVGNNEMGRQAFYRFAEKGVTMIPGSRPKGANHVAIFSDAVLHPDMEGLEFRYGVPPKGRRMRMINYHSPTEAGFTNLEELPPCQRLHMATGTGGVDGYRVGDLVEGFESGCKAAILEVDEAGSNLYVLIQDRYSGFATEEGGEKVVGPEGGSKIDTPSEAVFVSLMAAPYWDESFMNDHRGWPGSVAVDRQRLIFCDFRQLPDAILESEVGAPEAFDVSGDPAGALFEQVPKHERVIHVAGGSDQFIFTPTSIYYIPISADNPLAPGSIEFREIGTGGCGGIVPVSMSSAIVYMSADNARVMAVTPTGEQSRTYSLTALSRYHAGLIRNPIDLTVSYGQSVDSGEVLYILNNDGTIVVGRYIGGNDFVGFVPWTTTGNFVGVAALGQVVLLARSRHGIDTVEQLSYDRTLDCTIVTTNESGGANLVPFAGEILDRKIQGAYMGAELIDGTGHADVDTGGASTEWGYNFICHVKPFAPNFDKGQSFKQRLRRRKISQGAITVRNAGPFKINNTDYPGYQIGDDLALPPPLRNKTFVFRTQGRSYDPTFDLVQEQPYSLEVLEIGMEVTS